MKDYDRVNEGLSALGDGECDELETARVLKALRVGPALRLRWERIHRARAALHGERVDYLGAGFADKVARALEHEAHLMAPGRASAGTAGGRGRWRRPLAGMAIAASVALASIAALQTFGPAPSSAGGGQLAATSTPLPRPLAVPASINGGTRWNLERAELEQRLNQYLLNHMEYTVMGDIQGVLPYSRLAGYDRMPTQ